MERVCVEVVYARPEAQDLVRLELQDGATVRDALEASGMLLRHPEIDLRRASIGVYGKMATLGQRLRPGDRVEIYRPLLADPKQARRRRAAGR